MRPSLGIVCVPFVLLAASGAALADIGQSTRQSLLDLAKHRQLSADDLYAAASTFTPANNKEEFLCLNSGGQAGSIIVYGVPSMRILKYIPTGAPDSSTGYNFDEQSRRILSQGGIETQKLTWADTHHPGFSETNGKYDGRYAFINDKANPRIFVVDLRDFETKQIIVNPIFRSSHGGAFATPNTEYIIEGAQYPAPIDRKYYPLTQGNFNKYWRGGITFHKFDNARGRIIPEKSFTIIAPPYSQDLSDAGKGESEGFSFTNSFCSERYAADSTQKRPPYEAGCSSRDTDYLHVVDWKRAEKVVAEGKTKVVNGHKTIPLEIAAAEGVMYLIPEPKSPHGADVSPDGRFVVVAGKLDTHATVYDIRKIKELIGKKEFIGKDPYGVPILDLQKSIHGQVELGLGPLHTQFDPKQGVAYTSVYIDSAVVKWDYLNLKVLDKVSVHYNIGHLVSMQGDSQDPRGHYVVALNKLAIDRFDPVGPLHPQNHQLVDVSREKMKVIYDLPLPMGEPHYTVCIDPATLKTQDVYEVGTDPALMAPSSLATAPGKERVERKGRKVDVYGTMSAAGLRPLKIAVEQGDEVSFHLTNVEKTPDQGFKFLVNGMGAMSVFPPGKTATVRVVVSQAGLFRFRADPLAAASANHEFGLLAVKPNAAFEKARQMRLRARQQERQRLLASVSHTNVVKNLAPGQEQFESYGCSGCHQQAREAGGPDLTDVSVRRSKDWMKAWILNPEKYYDDPSVKPLIGRFGVKMPNQAVTPEDADKIIAYLDTWKSSSAPAGAVAQAGAVEAGAGAALYQKLCFACHAAGVAGAPKAGDKAVWGPRISQGKPVLYEHALKGFQGKVGLMPPKGGCTDCADDQVKAAVDYLVQKAQ